MIFSYLLLNSLFILAVLLLLRRYLIRPHRGWWLMFAALLTLTLIFDNLMITLGFFAYNPDKILGFYAYRAPIEDFMYALLAAIIIPALWHRFAPTRDPGETKQS